MMRSVMALLVCLGASVGLVADRAPAQAQSRQMDQANARAEMQAGRNMPIRELERQVVPRYEEQGWEYLTFEYDDVAAVYRLKFIRDGNLLFVDVDARTGQTLREQR